MRGLSYSATAIEPGYNDIGLYDTTSIASDILWYTFNHNVVLLGYNNTRL
jgi:hypothetical protein